MYQFQMPLFFKGDIRLQIFQVIRINAEIAETIRRIPGLQYFCAEQIALTAHLWH